MSVEKILEKIESLLDKFPDREKPNLQLVHIKWVLAESEQSLVPIHILTAALQQLGNAERNSANQNQYANLIDRMLENFSSPWNRKRTRSEAKSILDDLQNESERIGSQFKSELSEYSQEIEERQKELASFNEKLIAVQSKLDAEAQRLDNVVTNEQASLAEKKTKIDEDNALFIQQTKEQIAEKTEKDLSEFNTKLESELSSAKTDIANLKAESEKDRAKIKELLKITNEDVLTKDYSDLSNEEKTPSEIWSWIAAASLLAIPLSAIWMAVCYGIPDQITFTALLARFSLPLSFLLLGVFSARKSTVHREAFLRARRTHIRFSTLEPYLENFSETKRDEIREQLVEEFFKENISAPNKNPLIGLNVKQVTELVEKLSKAVKPSNGT